MNKYSKIYVAGHTGLVGRAVVKELKQRGYNNLILFPSFALDLRKGELVESFFERTEPEYVFLAAAKVGGIMANSTYPVEFLYDNLMIQSNIISAAAKYNTKKLLFFGSSCIYPKKCPQPVKEEYLLTSELESTNKPYAIAKIAGIELCKAYHKEYNKNFFSIMSTNLYGPYDNFDPDNSHVIPGLIRKFHEAKINNESEVSLWGSGKPKREFLFVEDLAEIAYFLMQGYENYNEIINIGYGSDISIANLAKLIKETIQYKGKIVFNPAFPDGTKKKLLDISKITQLGWKPKTSLKAGLKITYEWFTKKYSSLQSSNL